MNQNPTISKETQIQLETWKIRNRPNPAANHFSGFEAYWDQKFITGIPNIADWANDENQIYFHKTFQHFTGMWAISVACNYTHTHTHISII